MWDDACYNLQQPRPVIVEWRTFGYSKCDSHRLINCANMPHYLVVATGSLPIDQLDDENLLWFGEDPPETGGSIQQVSCMTAFVAIAANMHDASDCAREEAKTHGITVQSVDCQVYPLKRFIREAREFLGSSSTNTVMRLGGVVAFDEGASDAKRFAHGAIETACLRSGWQFWR